MKVNEVNDVILSKKEEAELVIKTIKEIVNRYGNATVTDFYDLVGLPTTYIDSKWGWTSLDDIPIRETSQGYLLELPPLEEI